MAHKVLKYLLDDTVNVVSPRYAISISVDGKLVKELGSHLIIKDDLTLAAIRVLKENKIETENCVVSIAETWDDLEYIKLVSFELKEDKLKPI